MKDCSSAVWGARVGCGNGGYADFTVFAGGGGLWVGKALRGEAGWI
jgi:hypothetical protein